MKNCLLGIDLQNDFILKDGAFGGAVVGAEDDVVRLSDWIIRNSHNLDSIVLSLDTHTYMHIAHSHFWVDSDGKDIPSYTIIKFQDVIDGKYRTRFYEDQHMASKYLYFIHMEQQHKLNTESPISVPDHIIWPDHVIQGTPGHAIHSKLQEAIKYWVLLTGKDVQYVIKGKYRYAEHYGIFCTQVKIPGEKETDFDYGTVNYINLFDQIFVAGEAKSHCVAASIGQLFKYDKETPIITKLRFLEDASSSVAGNPPGSEFSFDQIAQPIYDLAQEKGMIITNTKDEKYINL